MIKSYKTYLAICDGCREFFRDASSDNPVVFFSIPELCDAMTEQGWKYENPESEDSVAFCTKCDPIKNL